jgi:hypothetical protein
MEVTSEIYGETDFSSVKIASGSERKLSNSRAKLSCHLFLDVISKFKFDFPVRHYELMRQLEHDEDSDALVQRRKNECIEIGGNDLKVSS